MVLHTFLGQLLLVAGYAFASPLELVSRGNAPVANPPVNTLPQDIPQGLLRDVALKFKPYLKVDLSSCCLPYPAVNPEGFTSPGLNSMGDALKDCQQSQGQVYGRGVNSKDAQDFGNQTAIMYTWYFPKQFFSRKKGYKHNWEQIIVWLNYTGQENSGGADDFNIDRIAYSGPSGYSVGSVKTAPGTSRPLVQYYRRNDVWGVEPALDQGLDMNLVMWDTFTKAAREAVGNPKNFDKNLAPFSDAEKAPGWSLFKDHLKAAYQTLL